MSAIDSGAFRNPNFGFYVADSKTCKSGEDSGKSSLVGPRDETWWTGIPPTQCPGFDAKKGYLASLGSPDIENSTRQEWIDYFNNSWTLTDLIFSSLVGDNDAAFLHNPYHGLRHPFIFYYGHPAVVYINKCRVAGLVSEPLDAYLESVLETGVDEMSWDDMSKNEMEWPSVASVTEYRRKSYEIILGLFQTVEMPFRMSTPGWALVMGIEHDHIHLETTSCLMREMPLNFLRTPEYWPPVHASGFNDDAASRRTENEMIDVASGTVTLGKHTEFGSFGWDNEYGTRQMHVPAFRVSKFKVTNGEFLDFVKAGGYRDEKLWSAEGWAWRKYRNAKWPTWWIPDGPAGLHQYKLRNIFSVVNLPLSWPVCVNHHEARAFTNWMTKKHPGESPFRLALEVEHSRFRGIDQPTTEQDPGALVSGPEAAVKYGFNLGLNYSSETPVDALPANKNGIHDAMGNVWEWCEDEFNPLENFKVHPFYDDFSVPCFDGKHHMILGGSFISCGNLASAYARYHFRPHFFQHAGFRVVQSEDPAALERMKGTVSSYSAALVRLHSNALVSYGEPKDVFPNALPDQLTLLQSGMRLSQRCVDLIANEAKSRSLTIRSALDFDAGAAAGVTALSEIADRVVGVTTSPATCDFAKAAINTGKLEVHRVDEGVLRSSISLQIPSASSVSVKSEIVLAENLLSIETLGKFDVVMSVDYLDKHPMPLDVIETLKSSVAPNGLLLISSSFSWNENITSKAMWLGGFYSRQGHRVSSNEAVKTAVGSGYELISETRLPTSTLLENGSTVLGVSHTFLFSKLA